MHRWSRPNCQWWRPHTQTYPPIWCQWLVWRRHDGYERFRPITVATNRPCIHSANRKRSALSHVLWRRPINGPVSNRIVVFVGRQHNGRADGPRTRPMVRPDAANHCDRQPELFRPTVDAVSVEWCSKWFGLTCTRPHCERWWWPRCWANGRDRPLLDNCAYKFKINNLFKWEFLFFAYNSCRTSGNERLTDIISLAMILNSCSLKRTNISACFSFGTITSSPGYFFKLIYFYVQLYEMFLTHFSGPSVNRRNRWRLLPTEQLFGQIMSVGLEHFVTESIGRIIFGRIFN